MHQGGPNVGQTIHLARGQVDRVTVKAARAQQTVRLIGVQIVPRIRVNLGNPSDFVLLLGQMRLHEATGKLGPKRAEGGHLLWRGSGRKAWGDGIFCAANPMPFLDQRLAVIIGRLRRIAQICGRIAVHASLACNNPHRPLRRCIKKRIDRAWVNCGVGGDRRGAIGQYKIEVSPRYFSRIAWIAKPRLFGKRIGVQPVNEPFAPRRDHRGLRIVSMGINESGQDQFVAVPMLRRRRRLAAQRIGWPHRCDELPFDQHAVICHDAHRVRVQKRVAIGQKNLAGQKGLLGHPSSL
mmetsp:Transcript_23745/g.42565  ORF Transcript_23745/g.42565 Transcript_23745/m.42565 type:complete len:294 (-) Transcript_23745:56-937(-)